MKFVLPTLLRDMDGLDSGLIFDWSCGVFMGRVENALVWFTLIRVLPSLYIWQWSALRDIMRGNRTQNKLILYSHSGMLWRIKQMWLYACSLERGWLWYTWFRKCSLTTIPYEKKGQFCGPKETSWFSIWEYLVSLIEWWEYNVLDFRHWCMEFI